MLSSRAMSPGGCGAGAGANLPTDADTLAALYPACLGCRQQIDSLLASIDKNAVPPYSGRACSTSSSPGGAVVLSSSSRREDECMTSRAVPRCVSSSGARSTSSPAWSSGSGSADTPCEGGGTVATQQRLLGLSQQLSRDVARLCGAFERERLQLSQQQTLLWQRRITGLRDDAASLASAVHAEVGSMQSWVQDEHKQREELLQLRGSRGRSRHASSSRDRRAAAVDEAERAAATRWNKERRQEQASDLAWLREREKLQESSMMLETLFAQGRGVLDRMVQQNSVLRGAKKKLMKLTSAAGVSSTLIGAAARRQASDRRLIYGGMLLTLVFFFLLYRFAQTYTFGNLFSMGSPNSADIGTLETAVADMPQAMRR